MVVMPAGRFPSGPWSSGCSTVPEVSLVHSVAVARCQPSNHSLDPQQQNRPSHLDTNNTATYSTVALVPLMSTMDVWRGITYSVNSTDPLKHEIQSTAAKCKHL